MWTCPQCGRAFVNKHQWHSCIDASLATALSAASPHAVSLYRELESALADCGTFRVHPQKTRVAFVSEMTFASVKLARRWIDVSLITPSPIEDARVRSLDCYGPTSFDHSIRLGSSEELDADVRAWLCRAKRRGDRETLDPSGHVEPLVGRSLELVRVALRCVATVAEGDLSMSIPRYAAEVFALHPEVSAQLGKEQVRGHVVAADGRSRLAVEQDAANSLGINDGDPLDVFLRADI